MTETNNKKNKDHIKEKENSDIKKLKERISELEKNLAELENNWKRALADYQNLQKRTSEEKMNFVSFVNSTIIRKLLPVLDNLELVQNHLKDAGLQMIINEYQQILTDEGITQIEAEGKEFDSSTMEAVETVNGPQNRVMKVLQKGYFLNGKLLRPARVNVGKGE